MQLQSATTAVLKKSPVIAPKTKTGRKVIKKLDRTQLRSYLVRQKGKFFSVDYVKRDGVKRTLTGRLEVKSFLKGGQNNVEALARPYLVVFDVKLLDYRTVSLDTISQVRAAGVIWDVID